MRRRDRKLLLYSVEGRKMKAIEANAREKFDQVVAQIWAEYLFAINKFPVFRSKHEGYAIVKEELDELWEEIKVHDKKDGSRVNGEALQLATMAIRFLVDLGFDEKREYVASEGQSFHLKEQSSESQMQRTMRR